MSDDTPPDRIFRDGLEKGLIKLQKCRDCGRHVFYPRVLCPHCQGADLDWVEATGQAEVYTTTTVRRKPERGGDYNVCMIELAEGVRMMSRVEGMAPGDVTIGMSVRAFVGRIEGAPAVLCAPVEDLGRGA